jgi:hypothetical protein
MRGWQFEKREVGFLIPISESDMENAVNARGTAGTVTSCWLRIEYQTCVGTFS